ncbi:MAG: polysulfide reductase NrfD [Geminicoccaceae bacterium]|nr:polysulfide reductase NrfD [Geminicoccaceae bacterium]
MSAAAASSDASSSGSPGDSGTEGHLPPFVDRRDGYASVTKEVSDAVLERRPGRLWWLLLAFGGALTLLMLVSIAWLFYAGVGIWGVNTEVVWGFAIANYVWWIGIGNAGTLISSLLLLTRQKWRSSINRFAEAMTLFAAAIAGVFPIIHLGRPYLFYWLIPYPDVMEAWPQFKSPLVWDLWAILSYLIFSLLFWYTGAIPDFATLRDRAKGRIAQLAYGSLALGWRGSAHHWARYERYYWAMAAMGVPLVVSVHSVVGLDFAASLMPGWAETVFPPYFVVGAMFSGFAMVVTLAVPIRHALGLHDLITPRHFEAMAKIMVLGATVMGWSYLIEWFAAWYSGDIYERGLVVYEFVGDYWPLYWIMLFCNVLASQVFWFRPARYSIALIFVVSILVNLGMWLERLLIVINTLSHGFLPANWQTYAPTFWDVALLLGTLGFFFTLFLLLARFVPVVSMHEMRELVREEGAGR